MSEQDKIINRLEGDVEFRDQNIAEFCEDFTSALTAFRALSQRLRQRNPFAFTDKDVYLEMGRIADDLDALLVSLSALRLRGDMIEKNSRTWRIQNAIITLHGFSAGTAILNVTSVKESHNRASIWVSPEELRAIAAQFTALADDICKEPVSLSAEEPHA